MRNIYLTILLYIFCAPVFGQEKLSSEEKKKRQQNIEAANPFAKYGSKAKVATLSKGKYPEVHDLDSVVVIGSVRFNVERNEIVGYIVPDTITGEYDQPIGDVPSRWLSPDPLAEEFPSWSPYNMAYNNPVRYVDPDGRAAIDNDDLYINGDGAEATLNQMQAAASICTQTNDIAGIRRDFRFIQNYV